MVRVLNEDSMRTPHHDHDEDHEQSELLVRLVQDGYNHGDQDDQDEDGPHHDHLPHRIS